MIPSIDIQLKAQKACYFLSDLHLHPSAPNKEKEIVQLLDHLKNDAQYLFLLGDIFEFWFEYRYTIPRGFTRFLGKLAELSDKGVEIHFFHGNHDMWTKHYFTEELKVKIWNSLIHLQHGNLRFEIGHGDALGPGDLGYKIFKKIIRSPISSYLFSCLPSAISFPLAYAFSKQSRHSNEKYKNNLTKVRKQEFIIEYIKHIPPKQRVDVYIFGHRHRFFDLYINNSRYINPGYWDFEKKYIKYDGEIHILKWS
jgi:UDP-2,3-diacylglucosamine hydrolase